MALAWASVRKAGHKRRLRRIGLPDNFDDLVDVEIGNEQRVEHMKPLGDTVEDVEVGAAPWLPGRLTTRQKGLQALHPGPSVEAQDIHITR